MHRFFIPAAAATGQPITLTGDQAHQVRRVLRMRLGDRATLLDGQGWAYEGILIAVGETDVKFQAVRRWEAADEPATHITLYQAVLKGERFGWALQKGVEVGVSAFVPLICERNVVDDLAAAEGKRERWARIIQEAAEQCGRGRLPELRPAQLFAQAAQPTPPTLLRQAQDRLLPAKDGGEGRLILWEGEREARLHEALADCNFGPGAGIQLFVGPEGGFTEAEVALARSYGVRPVSLGPRILRAETAGVVAAALILYEAGEM
ncbi:MAG: rRNA (uracil1498-N3)-methyltransferase [Chloroflexota bacterium]|nr:rRNA (uracil1498-N3)-methyltransferase [Chloroflexota bacterium]